MFCEVYDTDTENDSKAFFIYQQTVLVQTRSVAAVSELLAKRL